MSLREYLTEEVANWETMGHPALLSRFVLRNGKEYAPTKRLGRRGPPKQCFRNATKAVQRFPRSPDHVRDWVYVEGFALHRTRPLLAFHHAWVTTDGQDAMDPTLDAADYEYFGVAFDRHSLLVESARNRYYGLLDTGLGMNAQLMFRMDPELEAIVHAVKPSALWRKLKEAKS